MRGAGAGRGEPAAGGGQVEEGARLHEADDRQDAREGGEGEAEASTRSMINKQELTYPSDIIYIAYLPSKYLDQERSMVVSFSCFHAWS